MEETIRPTLKNVEDHNLPIILRNVKVVVECARCGKTWSVFTEDEDALLTKLPSHWWKCSECRRNEKAANV